MLRPVRDGLQIVPRLDIFPMLRISARSRSGAALNGGQFPVLPVLGMHLRHGDCSVRCDEAKCLRFTDADTRATFHDAIGADSDYLTMG